MSLAQQIDVYCERTDFTFWSEPFNALSNLAFIIAAMAALHLYRQVNVKDGFAVIMISLLFVIGVGSFLFHTFATRWAAIADMVPIALIIFTYHMATMYKIAEWRSWVSVASLIIIPALGWVAYTLPLDFMGSTKAYAPVLLLLGLYFIYHYKKGSEHAYLLPVAILTFGTSMAVRIGDDHICSNFTHGLHWGWHILNATTLYFAFRAYILFPKGKM